MLCLLPVTFKCICVIIITCVVVVSIKVGICWLLEFKVPLLIVVIVNIIIILNPLNVYLLILIQLRNRLNMILSELLYNTGHITYCIKSKYI